MVAHGFELTDCVASRFLWVEAGEVVAAGIAVRPEFPILGCLGAVFACG